MVTFEVISIEEDDVQEVFLNTTPISLEENTSLKKVGILGRITLDPEDFRNPINIKKGVRVWVKHPDVVPALVKAPSGGRRKEDLFPTERKKPVDVNVEVN